MIAYDSTKHEMLLLKWYLDLSARPAEFEKLFAQPLRSLTELLKWAQGNVTLGFELDSQGIWVAAWYEPVMSGAFFGAWLREDRRGSFAAWRFIDRAYRVAFEHFPVLIGITQQPELDKLHHALGYQRLGVVPGLFDGKPALIYVLSKENYYGRRRQDLHQQRQQPLREDPGEHRTVDVEHGGADLRGDGGPDGRGVADGGNQRTNPHGQQRSRFSPKRVLKQ